MTPNGREDAHVAPPECGVEVISPDEASLRHAALTGEPWLLVELPIPGPVARHRLASLIDEAIESALAQRGAAALGVAATQDLDAALDDQLFRARAIGLQGLCLMIPPLHGMTGNTGVLEADDSAALRWWVEAATGRPLRLWIDDANRYLGIYGPPQPLYKVIALAGGGDHSSATLATTARSHAGDPQTEPRAAREPLARGIAKDRAASNARAEAAPGPGEERELTLPLEGASQRRSAQREPEPLHPHLAEHWPEWAKELESARGPRPLSAVERLFVSAYCPLTEAIHHGIAPASARAIAEQWARSFEHSYSEAFEALRLRGRRPSMVLDVPDLALRIARLHGARAVQLIVVDGMRFDLGQRVQRALERTIGDAATLTERLLTWAALPSTTSVQLELLGRGADGLRDRTAGLDSDLALARGRGARTLRRVKAGSREVLKLDLVESDLCDRGPRLLERLDRLAEEAADPLANCILQLPPRTLAVIFGDHGFICDADERGTSAGRHGGASPEEVLVPAYAWLTGAVH